MNNNITLLGNVCPFSLIGNNKLVQGWQLVYAAFKWTKTSTTAYQKNANILFAIMVAQKSKVVFHTPQNSASKDKTN